MGPRRDWRRVGAVSATMSAGAVVFFAIGTGPASAETSTMVRTAGECKLGPLLCSILNGGKGSASAPPKSSGSGSSKPTTKPTKPKPQPKPKPKPASGRATHSGSGGSGGSGSVNAPIAPPAAGAGGSAPEVAAPQQQGPALPDIVSRDPVVSPQDSPVGQDQATPARLVAASAPESDPVPPLLVATASGLIGAVTALNLSVLGRRLRRPR
ncbi:hypothetical protein GCM10023195_02900 [Actinoallomurus liliacearum]|uniref:Uncharacterized protein n=1 Tax=Actinoallomurus liliacearum TaxID=1080073 RepID=A0ABP8T947_9ACTN